MSRPYTPPGYGWILALLGLVLDVVLVVTHQLPLTEGGLLALAFLALLL